MADRSPVVMAGLLSLDYMVIHHARVVCDFIPQISESPRHLPFFLLRLM
jgi:hypothetical protein